MTSMAPQDVQNIVGRDEDVARLRTLIGPGRGGGSRVVLLSARPGSGLTTMLQLTARVLAQDGFDVTFLRGNRRRDPRLDPVSEGTPPLAPIDRVKRHVARDLETRAAVRPVVLIVDDADRLASRDAAIMNAITSIDREADVVLVAAGHGDGLYERFSLDPNSTILRQELRPLTRDSVAEIAARHMSRSTSGAEVEPRHDVIAARVGANVWLAVEFARTAGDEIPRSLQDWVKATLEHGDEVANAALTMLAVADHPLPESVLTDACQRDARIALAWLRDVGLAVRTQHGWSTASPAVSETVRRVRIASVRREIARILARSVERHADLDSAHSAEFLPVAARLAHLGGDVTHAHRLLDAAIAASRQDLDHDQVLSVLLLRADLTTEPTAHIDTLRLAASAARIAGDDRRAREVLQRLAARASSAGRSEDVAYALHELYWLEGPDPNHARLRTAIAAGGAGGWSERAAAALAFVEGRYEDGARHDATAIQHAENTGDVLLVALARQKRALCSELSGQPNDAREEYLASVEAALAAGMPRWAVHAELNASECADSLLDAGGASAAIERARCIVVAAALDHMHWEVDAFEALHLHRRGDLARAEAMIERARACADAAAVSSSERAILTAVRGAVLCDMGNERLTIEALRDLDRQATDTDDRLLLFELAMQRAQLALMRRNPRAALEHALEPPETEEVGEAGRTLLLVRLAAESSWDDARHWLALRAVRPAATDYARVARDAASAMLIDDHDERRASLLRAARRLEHGDRILDALRLEIAAWCLDQQHAPDRLAIDVVRELELRSRRMGLRSESDRFAGILRHAGHGTGARRTQSGGVLTPRELEVVQLVALGMRNREIGARLGIKPDTVTRRLTNAYRKTGTTSRVRLIQWLEREL